MSRPNKYSKGELVPVTDAEWEIFNKRQASRNLLDLKEQRAKAECRKRILDVVDETAQINLAAAAAANLLTAEQSSTYVAGLQWIAQMRATWPTLAADASADIYDNANWPQPTQAMRDLADAF